MSAGHAEPATIGADLSGKVCLVTGANSGIGKEATRALAAMGATVLMGCRDEERGHEAREELRHQQPDAQLDVLPVDLASQHSIRRFADRVRSDYDRLDVLLNNAGVWMHDRELTEDGIERTWAVNQLGYFLTTTLLLERLRASAPARVINVASRLAHDLDLDDPSFDRRTFDGMKAYAQSKQANRMFTWALASRLEGTGVSAHAIHPGGVDTGLFRHFRGMMKLGAIAYFRMLGRTAAEGADTAVWAAASPEIEGRNGCYFADRKEHHCPYRDPEQCERLWQLCERMTGVQE